MYRKPFLYLGAGGCLAVAVVIAFSTRSDRGASLNWTPLSETAPTSKESIGQPDTPAKSQNLLREVATGIHAARQSNDAEWQAQLAEWDEVRRLAAVHRRKEAERAALRAAKEQADQAWWEDRKEWIENFPFEPTIHPTMTFQESKQGKDRHGYWKWDVRDPEEERMMFELGRHSFVKNFYENPARYDRAFEKLYAILDEYGYGENVERLGNTYSVVADFHKNSAKAAEAPKGRAPGIAHNERGYFTWQEEADGMYDAIKGNMEDEKRLLPGEEPMPAEIAKAIRERILTEIPPEDFTGSFAYHAEYLKEVNPGDPLLMK